MHRTWSATGVVVGSLVFMGSASAGDLNPPAGPIAPTPGPEPRTAINADNTPGDADSIFRIVNPGSYYLPANVKGAAGKHGIEIAASDVTIDLMGFQVAGVAGSLDGITISVASAVNIEVRNGSVVDWGSDGVNLSDGGAVNTRIIDLRVSGNDVWGLKGGNQSVVSGCVGTGNGFGMLLGLGSTVTDCVSNSNTNMGIYTIGGCVIDGCVARDNDTNGFELGAGDVVRGCAASGNTGDGIVAGLGSVVEGCSASSNGDDGFVVSGGGNVVTGCVAVSNAGDGIEVQVGSIVRGNQCRTNGFGIGDGAGIHATSSDNRIEGNNCLQADRGIDVDNFGNVIVGNTCSGNTTNWDIVANNVVGPIVQGATNAAAIVGNTYAGSTGSIDPNTNYSY